MHNRWCAHTPGDLSHECFLIERAAEGGVQMYDMRVGAANRPDIGMQHTKAARDKAHPRRIEVVSLDRCLVKERGGDVGHAGQIGGEGMHILRDPVWQRWFRTNHQNAQGSFLIIHMRVSRGAIRPATRGWRRSFRFLKCCIRTFLDSPLNEKANPFEIVFACVIRCSIECIPRE